MARKKVSRRPARKAEALPDANDDLIEGSDFGAETTERTILTFVDDSPENVKSSLVA